ncbi:hypothetical protein niasHT_015082 [Heterodera trifolii]|uniref:Uncharacterized protein n=1 Tax=Heterodera trifolii TaxID=157864 RepID=A0ABD2L9L8_9BILA
MAEWRVGFGQCKREHISREKHSDQCKKQRAPECHERGETPAAGAIDRRSPGFSLNIKFQKRTVAHGCFPHEPVPIGGVHPFDVAAPHEPVPIGGVHPFDVAAPHKPVPIGGVQPFDVAAPHEPVPIGGVHPFDVAAPHQPVPMGGVHPFEVAAQRTQTYWTSLKLPPRTETYWTTLKLPPTQTNFPKSATQIRFPQIRTGAFFLLIPPHRYQSRKLINKKINNTSPLSSTSSVPVAMPSREKTNRYDTAHSHRR